MRTELEQLVAQVYRSTDDEVRAIAESLSPQKRAGFAIFCFSRWHLREQGVTLAELCESDDLRAAGGVLVSAQLAQQITQKRAQSVREGRPVFPQITLASQDLWAQRMAGAEDAELEEVDAGDDLSASLSVHFPDPV